MCDDSIVIICVKQLLLFVSTECDCLCFVCDNDWTVSDEQVHVSLLVFTNGLFALNEFRFYDLSRNLSVTLQTNIKDMNFLYDWVLGIIAGK